MVKYYIGLSIFLLIIFPLFPIDIDTFTNNGFGFEYKEKYLYDYHSFVEDFPNIISIYEKVLDEKNRTFKLEYKEYYVIYSVFKDSKYENYLFRSIWAKEGNFYYGVFLGQDCLDLARILNISISRNQRYITNHSSTGHDLTISISKDNKVEGIYWDYSLE